MPNILKHYFDPDFDHTHLSPEQGTQGAVDHHNLGYVQNVVAGQVLAEWDEVRQEDADQYDPRFVFQSPDFPLGANYEFDQDNPEQLMPDVYRVPEQFIKHSLSVEGW